jgi:hypothetical protein
MSDLMIFTPDNAATAIAFLQVFAGVGFVVLIGYGIKTYFYPDPVQRVALPPSRPRRNKKRLLRQRSVPRVAPPERTANVRQPGMLLPMPADQHWQRAIAPVYATIDHGKRARELHQSAMIRLDAADYAFGRMLDELKSVIALPANAAVVTRGQTPAFATCIARASLAA